jgi:hypothetical protein
LSFARKESSRFERGKKGVQEREVEVDQCARKGEAENNNILAMIGMQAQSPSP